MQPSRTKRQKVAVACGPCRAKKTKCDGHGPICQPCRKKARTGIKCTWQTSSVVPLAPSQLPTSNAPWIGAKADFQHSLLNQNTSSHHSRDGRTTSVALEGSNASTTAVDNGNLPSYAVPQPVIHLSTFPHQFASQSSHTHQTPEPLEHGLSGLHRHQEPTQQKPDEVSLSERSVHAIIGATLEEDSREGFFGGSSAGTFMQNVKKMVQQRVGRPHQAGQQPSSSQHVQSQSLPASGHRTITQKQVDYVLPSRRRADVLMGTYWTYVHVLYPYLDKMQVQADYERLWKADGKVPDEQSFMCLLNVTFALSSQLDEATPIEERAQLAHVFYTRAKELLDIVETGSVRSVQSFLLLGQYFQSTNEPHPCWVFIGLAVRTAQSLGLHLPETSERAADTRTRELLRKLWHGCVLMDRVVSMTYGRPCMIGPKAAVTVPVPSLVDEDEVALLRSSPFLGGETKETYSVEFFVLSLKLYEILHDVIFNFYSVNCQQIQPLDSDKCFGSLDESHSSIFEIERRLSKWEQSIPNHLRMANKPDSGGVEAVMYRQAVILHQRQLHVRTLLLRPVLSNFITSAFHDPKRYIPLRSLLSHRIFLQCAIVCVKVALEAINTIHRERGESAGSTGFLAAWWYNVLYIYTSATVLIAARLSPAILADVSEESILDGWRKAMGVLEVYSPFGVSIQRLTTTLRLLFEAVPQQYSRFRETARQIQSDASVELQSQAADTGSLPDWRALDPVSSVPDALDDLSREYSEDNNNALANDFLLGFDTVFDPNDLSWLTTIPLDSG